ncbi:serine/threonine-protein kinase SBK1-like [Ambystoma mexicanum]|uniref:serine/threonine-protein kinase SBK1-like n=1 Tax=Ambystoma mexicanum TaxID=8296 RepID=UPI0037E75425
MAWGIGQQKGAILVRQQSSGSGHQLAVSVLPSGFELTQKAGGVAQVPGGTSKGKYRGDGFQGRVVAAGDVDQALWEMGERSLTPGVRSRYRQGYGKFIQMIESNVIWGGSLEEQMTQYTMDQARDTASLLRELMNVISRTTAMLEIREHYDIQQRLGQGTFGKVLRARHRESGRAMALKMMRKSQVKRKAFLRELCISLLLSSHPSFITTYRLSCHTAYHFVIVQELALAGDLDSIMQPRLGIAEEKVKRVARQLSTALEYMHDRSLVHRDLKPDNVLLMDRECHDVRLSDFGLTRLEGYSVGSASRIIPYMSPEFCLLKRTETLVMDPSLDVWAFGILLFALLTGHFPWMQALAADKEYRAFVNWQLLANDAYTPAFWKRLTPGARQMFGRLLAIDPAQRIPVEDITRYLDIPWKVTSPPGNGVGSVSSAEGMEDSSPAASEDTEAAPLAGDGGILYTEDGPNMWLAVGAEIEIT